MARRPIPTAAQPRRSQPQRDNQQDRAGVSPVEQNELAAKELIVVKQLIDNVRQLIALDRYREAIKVLNDLLNRPQLVEARELQLREQLAKALLYKATALAGAGLHQGEIAIYDDIVARFGEASEPTLRDEVANALFAKGFRLIIQSRAGDKADAQTPISDAAVDAFRLAYKFAQNTETRILASAEASAVDFTEVFASDLNNRIDKIKNIVNIDSLKDNYFTMNNAAIDLNAAADELGLSKERAFEALKREAAAVASETTGRVFKNLPEGLARRYSKAPVPNAVLDEPENITEAYRVQNAIKRKKPEARLIHPDDAYWAGRIVRAHEKRLGNG